MNRANLFQKNIASSAESETIDLVNTFHNGLVDISPSKFMIKLDTGKTYSYQMKYSEEDFTSTTFIGTFENGVQFRFILRKGASLAIAKERFGANDSFTISSINPTGWAMHFFTTDENDSRKISVVEFGDEEQIQTLIDGAFMSIQFGVPQKFIELSKRLLPLIEKEPSRLLKFRKANEFVEILKGNKELYSAQEQIIINQI